MNVSRPVPLTVVPSAELREPALLEVSLEQLAEYAATAPHWRLARWSFVATADGHALVRGLPLPPLPGTQWIEEDGVCVPAGCRWSPEVEPAVVRQLLELAAGNIALLRADGSWDRVSAEDWVRASRSSVRCTQEAR
jgi:hypothetical protein